VSPASHSGGFGTLGHLAARFAGSLWPGPPSRAGEAWARQWLSASERALWARQSNQDRRHAIEVGHTVAEMLGDRDGAGVPREVLAAALLHDVGKVEAGLGTFGRVAATLAAGALGRQAVASWAESAGPERAWRRRAGRYVTHDQRGADLLRRAGSAAFVITWAREHHHPAATWTLDPALTHVLKEADGD
jgi:putative nucleotidyltransferase with HDIG domain